MVRALFWNIENFYGTDPQRAQQVVEHIKAFEPDIMGLSEIKDKAALRGILFEELQDYDFGITDGLQRIELLAGWKRGVFEQALFTQRREFRAGNPHLRPGSMLSVKLGGSFLNFLFLHLDSGTRDKDYNNRQEMFEKIWALRAKLLDIEGADSRFVVMGDLNTMGRRERGDKPEITGVKEIADLKRDAARSGMTLLDKDHPYTWTEVKPNGALGRQSDLDHVLISNNLIPVEGNKLARVRGWVEDTLSDEDRNAFIEKISDHCSVEIKIA